MKTKRITTVFLILGTLLVVAVGGIWLVLHGIPPSKVRTTEDRSNLEVGIGSPLSDSNIFQFHKGWTDSSSYYRMKTTDQEYTAILDAGNWKPASTDGTVGFGLRPLWWRAPSASPDWQYHRRPSPYGPGGFEILIRHAGSGRTYYMAFTE